MISTAMGSSLKLSVDFLVERKTKAVKYFSIILEVVHLLLQLDLLRFSLFV